MRIENFQNFFNIGAKVARQTSPMGQIASMLNEKAEKQSPLEIAKQALSEIQFRLDRQRDERIENALEGYKALRSRRNSYEDALSIQQGKLESFQTLSCRYDTLLNELSSAKTDYEAYAATDTLDMTQYNRLSLRVNSLEQELSAVDQEISSFVEQANRYTNSQKQYAAYLEKTDQNGYAAFQYQDQGEYTRENFASQTTDMIKRMEAGVHQWRERVFSYCKQYGLSPYDFESYLQDRHKLNDAYFAARQRVMELQYTTDGMAFENSVGPGKPAEGVAAPAKNNFDTVEVSGSVCDNMQRFRHPVTSLDEDISG